MSCNSQIVNRANTSFPVKPKLLFYFSVSGGLAQVVERSLSMSEDLGSMFGFSIFFFLRKLLLFFFLLLLANSLDNKQVFRCKLRLTILFKFLASRTSLCLGRTYWGTRSPPSLVGQERVTNP